MDSYLLSTLELVECLAFQFLVLNPAEKSVEIQIEQFVEKRSSVGLQELEASLASFSASSKDLAKKGVRNKLLMHSAAEL